MWISGEEAGKETNIAKHPSPGTTASRHSTNGQGTATNPCRISAMWLPLRSEVESLRHSSQTAVTGVRVMPVDCLSLEPGLFPPLTLAQQVGLAEGCQEDAGSSAEGLRFPFAARMTCGPSRMRQSALPLYASTGSGGHRLACIWARKRGDPVESRVYLAIFKNLFQKYVGCLDHLSCLQLCRLISLWVRVVAGKGAVEIPHIHQVQG